MAIAELERVLSWSPRPGQPEAQSPKPEAGSRSIALANRPSPTADMLRLAVGELARRSNPIFVAMRGLVFRMIPARVQQQRQARSVTFPGIGEVP